MRSPRSSGCRRGSFPASRLLAETPRLSERSEAAFRATGCWGVAEGAALAAAGPDGRAGRAEAQIAARDLRRRARAGSRSTPRRSAGRAAGSPSSASARAIRPGAPRRRALRWRRRAMSSATASISICSAGRSPASGGMPARSATRRRERARLALDLAAEGRSVALVSSGDAGIYGLAPLVFELLDTRADRRDWRAIEHRGRARASRAMQAAAARAGAPLGHDFCAISLSDLMTPWEAIRARLEAAAAADFVVALYNPRSARRQARLAEAAQILLRHAPPETPVFIARNLGRDGEERPHHPARRNWPTPRSTC